MKLNKIGILTTSLEPQGNVYGSLPTYGEKPLSNRLHPRLSELAQDP